MNSSVLMIYTGGTIGMKTNEKTGALAPFDFNQIKDEVPELKKIKTKIDTITFDPLLDSSDINPENWAQMARIIKQEYDKYDGFVILHGTDTMAYSASALSYMLKGLTKPIIFTGSQIPIGELRTDGKENILTSVEIAAAKKSNGEAIVPEVCICFQDKLLRGNRTRKYSAECLAAFRSENYPALAEVGIDIHYNHPFIKKIDYTTKFDIDVRYCNDVVVVSLYPGINQKALSAMLNIDELKGVVLRTYGSGNAPTQKWFYEEIEKCINKGVQIINVTQCNSGTVQMSIYDAGKKLSEIGVLSGYDSTTEAAITKLITLLGRKLSEDILKKELTSSFSGEISLRME